MSSETDGFSVAGGWTLDNNDLGDSRVEISDGQLTNFYSASA